MRHDAKKVVAHAKVEGCEDIWTIQCDLFYLPDGRPVAIFDWGSDMELLEGRYARLRRELLSPSTKPGIQFNYHNQNEPILIPKELSNQSAPLTQEAFRREFFRIG